MLTYAKPQPTARMIFEEIRERSYRFPETVAQSRRGTDAMHWSQNCLVKNMELGERLQALGYKVTPVVIAFEWQKLGLPEEIIALWPVQYPVLHFYIIAEKDGVRHLLDASWDSGLAQALGYHLGTFDERTIPGLTATRVLSSEDLKALEAQWTDDYAHTYFQNVAPFMKTANAWLAAQRKAGGHSSESFG